MWFTRYWPLKSCLKLRTAAVQSSYNVELWVATAECYPTHPNIRRRHFFFYGSTAQFWALAASMKLSVSFQLLDLGQSAGLLGQVISSSQSLCVSAPGDSEDGEVGGMNGFGRGNRSTGRKPAPTPLCPPQIPLVRSGREPGPPRWEASD
jgi:hypothetical protein